MPYRAGAHMQLDLFGPPAEAELKPVVDSAPVPSELITLRQQLPPTIYLGTSSWAFAGWRGLVFHEKAPKSKLARHGLGAYAQHPLMRTVGVDRTYYAPISKDDFAAYADTVPEDFRFLVKAHELCTLAYFRSTGRYAQRRGERNLHFLDPEYATAHVVNPCLEGLGAKAGPLLFQFPPQSAAMVGGPERFASQLHTFLRALPPDLLYAVELRNTELFTSSYVDVLIDVGAVHCFNVHPSMPSLPAQYHTAANAAAPALVVRWMLHPGQAYDAAKKRYEPFRSAG